MGFKVAWAAIRGKSREAVLAIYGLEVDREAEEYDDLIFDGVCGVILGEWYVVFSNISIHNPTGLQYWDIPFEDLSADGAQVIGLMAHSTSMNTEACEWHDGVRRWWLYHDGSTSVRHLDIEGQPPPEFAPIRDKAFAEQEGVWNVDYVYSIPEDLCRQLTGFSHSLDMVGARFEVLQRI